MGIHGQQVWIDRASKSPCATGIRSLPVNDRLDRKVIAVMKAVSAA
jgi:hypothetical protein